jgi:hypothetical protein
MECTSQWTGADLLHEVDVSGIIRIAFRFFMYPYFMPEGTVKKVPFNVVCINMTDWEVQIFISCL